MYIYFRVPVCVILAHTSFYVAALHTAVLSPSQTSPPLHVCGFCPVRPKLHLQAFTHS